ncbi:MAG: response regulator transcription factor, partial [bacterium]|nr:response regulator transcription factor [bacterium]
MVVFVTAYDEHALRAFEVHAFDYLLKPFDSERFSRTLAAARDQISRYRQGGSSSKALEALVAELGGRKRYPARIPVKSSGKIIFLRIPDIDWVEAADNYVCLHVAGETHLLRETMTGLEERLDPEQFARIHRSTTVNLDRANELRNWFHGEHLVVLRAGTEPNLSRGD